MDLIEIFKALGDENRRIRILNLLIKQELCVCEIETVLEMTQPNVSRHLNKLKSAGIITSEKKSQWVYYRLDNKFIEENNLLYKFLKSNIYRSESSTESSSAFNCVLKGGLNH